VDGRRRRTWRERLNGEYREHVSPQSGAPLVVVARPKTHVLDAGLDTPFSSVLLAVAWMVVVEAWFTFRHKRRWVVQVYPSRRPAEARTIAETGKRQAFTLVESEAAALRSTEK
jgi:hypothetical protein